MSIITDKKQLEEINLKLIIADGKGKGIFREFLFVTPDGNIYKCNEIPFSSAKGVAQHDGHVAAVVYGNTGCLDPRKWDAETDYWKDTTISLAKNIYLAELAGQGYSFIKFETLPIQVQQYALQLLQIPE